MPVTWLWENKKGKVVWEKRPDCTNPKVTQKSFAWNIYEANCLGAFLYEWKDKKEGPMYQFMTFFNDAQHMKRILGLVKDYRGEKSNLFNDWYGDYRIKYISLDMNYKSNATLAKYFVEAGFEVRLVKGKVKNKKETK
jgi:hypothetical protein